MEHEPGFDAVEAFERHRPRLFGIAYRMLGSIADAEDVVQSAYLPWSQAGAAGARNPEAWLVSLVTRRAIDRLRSASAERERYVGDWLPEPMLTATPPDADRRAELASDISMAFLVLLERLSPDERAAFLLREVFGAGYAEIALVLERSEEACRQLVHRAKGRVRDDRARFPVAAGAKERLLGRFLAALHAADEEALLEVVAEDATWTSDGGGKIPVARNLRGAARIARFQVRLARKLLRRGLRLELVGLNGEPAIATWAGDRLVSTLSAGTDGARLTAFYAVVNPDKLRHATRVRSLAARRISSSPGGSRT
jgi:RNA polymerase sigma-70 factor (ECF subfamily)